MSEKAYVVNLELFEGPLDLLLFLVKKDDLDIHHIPIAHITKCLIGGENFNTKHRRKRDDGILWIGVSEDANVGDAIASRPNLHAVLCERPHSPLQPHLAEDTPHNDLHMRVWLLSHVSFPQLAVEIVTVGPIGRLEVLAHRDDNRAGHGGHPLRTE